MRIVDKDRTKTSAGGARAKSPNLTIMKVEDLLERPIRNAKGVLMIGNFAMKVGKEPVRLYATPSKQIPSFEMEGDEDSASITKNFEAFHPGDTLEIQEFIQEFTDQEVIMIYGACDTPDKKVFGEPCAAMKMRASLVDDQDMLGYNLTFTQMNKDTTLPGLYRGPMPTANFFQATSEDLSLTQENGVLVKLASSELGESVDVVEIDLENNQFVTIAGGGGTSPQVINDGATTEATFVLKDGTAFIGLEGSRITFEVFVAGNTTFLIERNRS